MHYLAVLLSTCWRVICTRLHFMLFDGSIFSWVSYTHTHTHPHTNTKKKVGDFSVYVNIKTVRVKNQTNTLHHTQTHTNREKKDRPLDRLRWAKTFFFMRPLPERGLRRKKNINVFSGSFFVLQLNVH